MAELIYIDTNVWLDYLLNRTDRLRPLGEFAFELFRKSVECKYEILVSGFVLFELKKYVSNNKISEVIAWLKENNKVIFYTITPQNIKDAKQYAHWQDALHAIVASKNNCAILVTRNSKDFSDFSDILQIQFPENL